MEEKLKVESRKLEGGQWKVISEQKAVTRMGVAHVLWVKWISPLEDWISPLEERRSPLVKWFAPLEESRSPLEDWISPLEERCSPLVKWFTPLEEPVSPLVDRTIPEVEGLTPVENWIPPWVNIDFSIEDSGSRAETGSSEGHAARNFRDEARNFHSFSIPNSKKSPATHGPGF